MNPNEQVEKEAVDHANQVDEPENASWHGRYSSFKVGYASGKKAGRQEAIDEMVARGNEGFEELLKTASEQEIPTSVSAINAAEFAWTVARTPLLARIKQLESQNQYNKEWVDVAAEKILTLESDKRCLELQNEKIVKEYHEQKARHQEALRVKDSEIESLRLNLNTCKNDYWFMSNLLERYSTDKEQAIKDCINRMTYRAALFKILDKAKEMSK